MSLTRREYRDSLKRDLQQAAKTKLKMNVRFITKGCCIECDKLADIVLPFEETMESLL